MSEDFEVDITIMDVRLPDGSIGKRPVESMQRDEFTGMMMYLPRLNEGEKAVYTTDSLIPIIVNALG